MRKINLEKLFDRLTLLGALTLTVALSADAFCADPSPEGGIYPGVQVPVCAVFLGDFFVHLALARRKMLFAARYWWVVPLSIPYGVLEIPGGVHELLRFAPMIRAALATGMLMAFAVKWKSMRLFSTYAVIIALSLYFSSLVFYIYEGHGVNANVSDYGNALWFITLQASTLGTSWFAVTTAGKAAAMTASVTGMLMLPVFTAYLTQAVRRYVGR